MNNIHPISARFPYAKNTAQVPLAVPGMGGQTVRLRSESASALVRANQAVRLGGKIIPLRGVKAYHMIDTLAEIDRVGYARVKAMIVGG